MKKLFNTMIVAALLMAGVCISDSASAQAPPPPPVGGTGSGNDQPIGGTAPIGGGLILLLSMGAGYALKKFYANENAQ